jgi:hypothetical protein
MTERHPKSDSIKGTESESAPWLFIWYLPIITGKEFTPADG